MNSLKWYEILMLIFMVMMGLGLEGMFLFKFGYQAYPTFIIPVVFSTFWWESTKELRNDPYWNSP